MGTCKKASVVSVALFLWAALSAAESSPYPVSPVISGITWDTNTHSSTANGSDLWPTTWGSDGNVYTSWGDGGGFGGADAGLGFARVSGGPTSYVGANLWSRPRPGGKSTGIVCVDGVLYAWINEQDGTWPNVSTGLGKSTNLGSSWTFSTSIWPNTTGSFRPFSFLQFGRDNAGARDSYVYSYGEKIRNPRDIFLARVPKSSIMTRSTYEFFAGLNSSGIPIWTTDVGQIEPVFSDPNSSSETSVLGHVIYNPGIGRYILATARDRNMGRLSISDAPERMCSALPSSRGHMLWPAPWGFSAGRASRLPSATFQRHPATVSTFPASDALFLQAVCL